ncbi:SPRY domain-containing protein, putative [Eimeria praecox]|uniref:SPRY domain-containing protein, putative n=1 Tax=Eimeria praecox TaxID=51316 RepID=U6GFQ4_9EIME|nr:SPRY domain-containing protein, putative [Eimeria praecox]
MVTDEPTLQHRTQKREREEGKMVPVSAVMDMKAAFALPAFDDGFTVIDYVEMPEQESRREIRRINEEGRAFKANNPGMGGAQGAPTNHLGVEGRLPNHRGVRGAPMGGPMGAPREVEVTGVIGGRSSSSSSIGVVGAPKGVGSSTATAGEVDSMLQGVGVMDMEGTTQGHRVTTLPINSSSSSSSSNTMDGSRAMIAIIMQINDSSRGSMIRDIDKEGSSSIRRHTQATEAGATPTTILEEEEEEEAPLWVAIINSDDIKCCV